MKYNPKIHNRQSIRLKGWDYSSTGLYFITICAQNHECIFGHIENAKMYLNDAGKMVEKWYFEMGNKYPNIKCDEHIVMPNHFHCIIEIMDAHDMDAHDMDAHVGTSLRGRPENDVRSQNDIYTKQPYGPDNKKYNASIFDMMDWFKTMTTNAYIRGVKTENWPRFEKRVWQKRYWDRIIRNENDYNRIANYIISNPAKWDEDQLNANKK